MSRLDDLLREELRRLAPRPGEEDPFERVHRRRRRRRVVRRIQAGALAVAVVAGTIGGTYALARIFATSRTQPATPGPGNGLIVFSARSERGVHLLAISPEGGEPRQLTPPGAATYIDAAASPDGRTILVVHTIPSMQDGRAVLATVPVEGGSPTWLTDPIVVSDPAWSPDGSRIAFAGSPGGPYGIYILDVATGGFRLVPGTDAIDVAHPTWSADGTRIAFQASSGASQDQGPWDIYVAPVAGSYDVIETPPAGQGFEDLVNITATPEVSETSPAWSPDGGWIAFSVDGRPYLMRPDGSERRDLFAILPGDVHPPADDLAWSPDGRFLAFSGTTGEGEDFTYTFRLQDGAIDLVGRGEDPTWQPLPAGAPSPAVEPRPSLDDGLGRDVGLPFRLCHVEGLRGIDLMGDGTEDTAWTGAPLREDGSCPEGFEETIVAVDVTGDGLADAWWGPLEHCVMCEPWDATDLDADGDEELVVLAQAASTPQFLLFSVRPGPELAPVTVAAPGHGPAGLRPGEPLSIWTGGDEGFQGTVACEGYPEDPVLVVAWAYHPVEGPGSGTEEVHVARLALQPDGTVRVVDAIDTTQPVGDPLPPPFGSDGRACGVDLQPFD